MVCFLDGADDVKNVYVPIAFSSSVAFLRSGITGRILAVSAGWVELALRYRGPKNSLMTGHITCHRDDPAGAPLVQTG
jgi:hypothetical protein